jgi:hypothetical protein
MLDKIIANADTPADALSSKPVAGSKAENTFVFGPSYTP